MSVTTATSRKPRAAIGLRVKSGWASAVLVVDSIEGVRVVDRRVVDLSDPRVPKSRQPFHPAMALTGDAAERVVAPLRRAVERTTNRSLAALIGDYRTSGHDLVGVGLVVGSDVDPTRICESTRPSARDGGSPVPGDRRARRSVIRAAIHCRCRTPGIRRGGSNPAALGD